LVATGITALALIAVVAGPAHADNDFAAAYRITYTGSPDLHQNDSFRGNQEIRTNPATSSGITFAHPMQVYFSGTSFFAVGTYKGAAVDACAANASGPWSVYEDGERPDGTYFCRTLMVDAFRIGDNPKFRLVRQACGWASMVNGAKYNCRTSFQEYAQGAGAGMEVASPANITASYNIDVKHTQLELHSYFLNFWYDLDADRFDIDRADYYVTRPSTRALNSFLAPLD
jgi:hypothetical protein